MSDHFQCDSSGNAISIIEEEAKAVAKSFGVAASDEAASSLVERLLFRLGGSHIYIPKLTAASRKKIHREICDQFNGRNLFDLAIAFQLSPRHVRRIIALHNRRDTKKS